MRNPNDFPNNQWNMENKSLVSLDLKSYTNISVDKCIKHLGNQHLPVNLYISWKIYLKFIFIILKQDILFDAAPPCISWK